MRRLYEDILEEQLLEYGVIPQLGQACAEDEYFNPQTQQCEKYPDYPPMPPPAPEDPPEGPGSCPEGYTWWEEQKLCWPGTQPGLPPDFVAPGAVEVRPGNWDLDHEPYATYVLAWGDTYVGLAATYLGDGARWKEIWALNKAQHPNPDKIYVSQVINMPHEARDKMRRWLKRKKGLPGDLPERPTIEEHARNWAPYLLVGALAAGAVYYVSTA